MMLIKLALIAFMIIIVTVCSFIYIRVRRDQQKEREKFAKIASAWPESQPHVYPPKSGPKGFTRS